MLAEYVQIGAEEDRQQAPLLLPAIPSRASYLTLLDAFEAVYQNRTEHASPREAAGQPERGSEGPVAAGD